METRNSSKNDELKENNVDSSSSSAIHGKMSRSFSMDSLQILNNTPSIPAVSEVIDPSDSIFEASLDTAVSGPQLKDVNLLLPARFIGSPYAKGFKKLTNHKLNKLVQKHIVIKDDKVSLDYENEEVKA
jgi:hypothetical protein